MGAPANLEEQGYKLVGNHSAVKTCHWTKRCVRDEARCYKGDFYGVESHRCVQMTPSVTGCTQGCLFCWRDQRVDGEPGRHGWDDPSTIAEGVLEAHRELMVGYKGSPEVVPRRLFEEAMEPRQAAISLAGEPTLYPRLPELIKEFHRRGLTTFLVTNGTNPVAVEKVKPNQLYLSLDAADEATYGELCRPREDGAWNDVVESLGVLEGHSCRTAVRVTLVRGLNDDPEGYAELLERGDPDFVEVKAYMHIGRSRGRLERRRMPSHGEVLDFASKLESDLASHDLVDEVERSRVALLSGRGVDTRSLQG